MSTHCLGVIPARYQSERLPGKPLATIDDKPMVQWVYERASQARTLDDVLIATDDARIAEAVKAFGGDVVMTSASHQSGTDRIAEVAEGAQTDLVVNIQGDEPLIEPAVIDAAVRPLLDDPAIEMGTIACPMAQEDLEDPNVVKVVFDNQHRALYFSRAAIPHQARPQPSGTMQELMHWQHIGLYVYRKEFLLQFTNYPRGKLEQLERLEQLRALENGHTIHVEPTEYRSISVDTPEDLEHVRQIFQTTGITR